MRNTPSSVLFWLALSAALLWVVPASVCGQGSQSPAAQPDPRAVFQQAQRALAAGDYARAESGFRQVLKLDPHAATAAYVNLGVIYMRTEKYDAAIDSLKKAQALAPQVVGIDLNLGLAY